MRRLITPPRISVLALLALIPLAISDTAWATTGPAPSVTEVDSHTSAKADGGTVSATAGGVVVFDTSKNGSGTSAGTVTSSTSWTPPACYYAPKYTPKAMAATMTVGAMAILVSSHASARPATSPAAAERPAQNQSSSAVSPRTTMGWRLRRWGRKVTSPSRVPS